MDKASEILWEKGCIWRVVTLIFVTVGTHNQQFNRLLIEVDKIIGEGKIKNVVAQIGHSTYVPKNYKWFKFLDFEEMIKLQRRSDMIITHAGVGSIMTALDIGKPIIVVPRLPKYNEHVDNHQLFTARELEKDDRVMAVYDIKNLGKAIEKAKKFKTNPGLKKSKILTIIADYLSGIEKN